MTSNTLFITPEESARIQETVCNRLKQRKDQKGQSREHKDAKALIQQAVSASLMQDISSTVFGLSGSQKAKETMPAYGVGEPYLPCIKELNELEQMKIKDLCMETHHRGFFLCLLRVSPVVILEASSWAIVQDRFSGDVERIEVFLHKSQHGRDLLDTVSELLVKEPYYTINNHGESTIQVNHPSDLIVTDISDNLESWRQEPSGVSSRESISPEAYKKRGNHALLKKSNPSLAHFYYSQGLKLLADSKLYGTLRNDLYRNRSYVNLQLKRFDEAKCDALSSITSEQGCETKSLNAKAYNRAGLASYGQGEFIQARLYFEQQHKLQPEDQDEALHLKRVDARLREATEGVYNMRRIVSSLTKTGGRPDASSFAGPTEIKLSPVGGRGLFATRDISPNEIIMCEKAFCVAWSHEPETFNALACDTREETAIKVFPSGLHKAVVQKLLNNPSQVEKIMGLHGDYKGTGKRLIEVDDVPVIDTFQIHDVVQRNAFGLGQQTEDEDVSNASTGLWVRASYINHSCIPNAKKDFIGDLILFRTTRRIAAGEEITHSYDESTSYEVRQAAFLKTWNFECRCLLCLVQKEESDTSRRLREQAEERASIFVESNDPACASRVLVRKGEMLRKALDATYDEERYRGLPRPSLAAIDEWLRISGCI
ncbi:n-lysine methyltransferase smyd2 [Fusarium sporotrichioides]|uniref:N-lysine methyltransferase smyd2 n=1 Tax=Fusarium sporotrichioides TaxID=5514 RepID=A0A395SQC7_FUSSP|nr:n-lysine methyltransferase smyd2 [Fusarium sporotrichioides]